MKYFVLYIFAVAISFENAYSIDIRKCELSMNNCSINEICLNRNGSYECHCERGFRRSSPTRDCDDINECKENIHDCSTFETCWNTYGSYECQCGIGYIKDSTGACVDVNECKENIYICNILTETCFNTNGSYKCHCAPGYERNLTTGYCVVTNTFQGSSDFGTEVKVKEAIGDAGQEFMAPVLEVMDDLDEEEPDADIGNEFNDERIMYKKEIEMERNPELQPRLELYSAPSNQAHGTNQDNGQEFVTETETSSELEVMDHDSDEEEPDADIDNEFNDESIMSEKEIEMKRNPKLQPRLEPNSVPSNQAQARISVAVTTLLLTIIIRTIRSYFY